MNRAVLARVALVLAVVAALAYWAWHNLEWVEVSRPGAASKEVRANPLLAVERLATRLGYPARRVADAAELGALPDDATLFAGGLAASPMLATVLPGLDAWVRAGGHLVITTGGRSRADPLGAHFGIGQSVHYLALRPPTLRIEGRDLTVDLSACNAFAGPSETLWRVPLGEAFLRPRGGDTSPEPDRTRLSTVARWAHGAGRITALCSPRPLDNDHVGRRDNAEFAMRVLLTERTASVRIFPAADPPPGLLSWLTRHAWPWLVGIVTIALLALWRGVVRFGPIRGEPARAPPGLGRHLRAVAGFMRGRGAHDHLLAVLRDECRRLMEMRESGDDPIARLAARTGLSAERLTDALAGPPQGRRQWRARATTLVNVIDRLRGHVPASPVDKDPT